jgi:ABC-2 type transport system ATP-binding protein
MTASASTPLAPAVPTPGADLAIATEGLTRLFRGIPAVEEVNLRVPRGGTYGFIGLNGAGKTTTIRMIMGLLAPTSGRVLLRGVDVARDRERSRLRVGFVPDRCIVHPWMRVDEAIWFCRRLQPRWNDGYCADLLKRFRIDAGKRVGKLSKGTAAKLSLLLALSHEPDVLILDEPTDGLDPVARDDFLEGVLASVCEHDRTVLMSSHALSDVERMADHLGLIHNGRLAIQCGMEELVRTTKRIRLVLPDGGTPPKAPPGAILIRREGRECTITIRGFDPAMLPGLQTAAGAAHTAVEDLTLDSIFKDFVRGQEAQS